jgi:hypothetical protein
MCVAWFMAHNRFSDFAASVHSYNRFYAGDLVLNLLGWLNPRMLRASAFLWLYVPLGVALFLMIRAPVKAKILTLVGLVSIAVAIAAPGNFYIHYYQLALPWCVLALGVFTTIVKRLPTIFVLSLTVLSVVVGEGALWLLPDFHRHPFSRSSPQRSAQLFAPHLRDSLKPGEWFLDLTSSPGLYLDSGIVPRHGVFHLAPLVEGPERARLRQKLIDILNQQPPRFIVTSDANTLSLFDSEADIARFFSRYKPVLFQSPFTVYALSDREAE